MAARGCPAGLSACRGRGHGNGGSARSQGAVDGIDEGASSGGWGGDRAGRGAVADGGAVAGAGLEEGDGTARGLERGHGEVGGRPRSSLKV
jgi:hypothetical protein